MNVSGPPIAKAWKAFLSSLPPDDRPHAKLVILHDELEAELGVLKVKPGSNSARGHNGLKSLKGSLPDGKWTRIGVGIGRPISRESRDVAGFVLGKMKREEVEVVEGVAERVLGLLEEMRGA